MVDGNAKAGGYPWHTVMQGSSEVERENLSLRLPDGSIRNLTVSANAFNGEKGQVIGAIVTFGDMTKEQNNADQLVRAAELLKQTQYEVERQKRELEYLANHDTLTGCLNRRAFMAQLDVSLEQAKQRRLIAVVMMVDIDQRRQIRTNYGPAIGDSLKKCCR